MAEDTGRIVPFLEVGGRGYRAYRAHFPGSAFSPTQILVLDNSGSDSE